MQRRWPSVEKARRLLGWEARVDLRDGLAETVAWLRDQEREAAVNSSRSKLNAQPRVSSSANIAAGSMQRSGGCAPVAVSAPRANRRTQAAAGAAVETTEPPRPKWGRVIARAVTSPRSSAARP